MLAQIRQTIRAHALLPAGGRVVCALSGGGDSVALVHALGQLGYPVCVCHFDHGLRETSLRDLEFVQQWCAKIGVPLYVERGDVPALMRRTGLSVEAAARQARYAFFERAMAHFGCDTCATAHHLNDQAETLLLRLARGARSGLNGIAYQNGAYIRPMRDVTKEEILQYLKENQLSCVTDETNADNEIDRNRVRNLVLPQLEAVNAGAVKNLCRSMAQLMEAQELAQKWADSIPVGDTLEKTVLDALPKEVASRAAYAFLTRLGAKEIGQKQLDALIQANKTGTTLVYLGVTVFFDGRIWRKKAEAAPEFSFALAPGAYRLPGGRLQIALCERPPEIKTGRYEQYFDLDLMPQACTVRTRRAGDYLYPIGLGGKKKLKELLIDLKIPKDLRDRLPMVAVGSEILWACGAAASEKIAVKTDTKRFLHIKYDFEEAHIDESPDERYRKRPDLQ